MIKIEQWNLLNKNLSLINLLETSFNGKEFHLINKKTIMINIYVKDDLVGSISILSNTNLVDYINKTGKDILSTYSVKAEKGIYFYNLAVNNKYRKKGIATKLVNIAIYVSKLKGYKYCHLHAENGISKNLFKNKGFLLENTFRNNKNEEIDVMSYWLK